MSFSIKEGDIYKCHNSAVFGRCQDEGVIHLNRGDFVMLIGETLNRKDNFFPECSVFHFKTKRIVILSSERFRAHFRNVNYQTIEDNQQL